VGSDDISPISVLVSIILVVTVGVVLHTSMFDGKFPHFSDLLEEDTENIWLVLADEKSKKVQ
jgi:hypothetical protein